MPNNIDVLQNMGFDTGGTPEKSASDDVLQSMGFDTGGSRVEQPRAAQVTDVPTPDWVRQQQAGIEEAYSPVEVAASIFGAGSFMALKGGAKLGVALGRGLLQGVVGGTTDIPVSLTSEIVRERYGWGTALTYELATSLAVGMTADQFIERKLRSLGKKYATPDRVKQLINKAPQEAAKDFDGINKLLNVVEDIPNLRKAIEPQIEKLEDLPLLYPPKIKDAAEFATVKKGRAKLVEPTKQAQVWEQVKKRQAGRPTES